MANVARCLVEFGYSGSARLCARDEDHVGAHSGPLIGSYACQVYRELLDAREAVPLSDDERKALAWAARRGAHELRSEGWPDMARNAEILDGVLPRIEGDR